MTSRASVLKQYTPLTRVSSLAKHMCADGASAKWVPASHIRPGAMIIAMVPAGEGPKPRPLTISRIYGSGFMSFPHYTLRGPAQLRYPSHVESNITGRRPSYINTTEAIWVSFRSQVIGRDNEILALFKGESPDVLIPHQDRLLDGRWYALQYSRELKFYGVEQPPPERPADFRGWTVKTSRVADQESWRKGLVWDAELING